ncbi:MAG: MscL family protein [Tepidisphaeraceae bacterium]|jgi:large conductance mechanosensitive channel
MKSRLWQEFKSFAFKGNMIDLAVAVVIGAAFSGVVNSLVKEIIMPSITYISMAAQTGAQTAAKVAEKTEAVVGVATQPASTQPAEASANAPPPVATPPASAPPAASDNNLVNTSWIISRIHFHLRNFLAELLNFLLVSFAVFITIVKLLGSVMKKVGGEPAPSEPTTKECPKCLSLIPIKATKCAHCTADLP